MAFQAVPSTAEFSVRMSGPSGQDIRTGFHVRNITLGWPAARLSAVATTIGNGWRDQIMPLLTTVVTLDRVDARDLGAEFGDTAVVEYNTAGTAGANALPMSVAALVKLTGSSGAPPRQGRMFIGGLDESNVSGDALAGGFITALGTALTAINASIAGGGDAWVIVSRYSKLETPVAPHKRAVGLTNTIQARTVRSIVGSQRDRRVFEGS